MSDFPQWLTDLVDATPTTTEGLRAHSLSDPADHAAIAAERALEGRVS